MGPKKKYNSDKKMHWSPIEKDKNAKEKYKSYQLIADVQYKVQQFCSPEIQNRSISCYDLFGFFKSKKCLFLLSPTGNKGLSQLDVS